MIAARLLQLALVSSAAACTLLSDLSIHQCDSNTDCDTLDGQIQRCEASRCVAGCQDNHHCAAFDPRYPICAATGASCAGLRSDDGSCFASTTYDDATMGAMTAENMTILGAFAPTLESPTWLTLELAAAELAAARDLDPSALAPTLVVSCRGEPRSVVSSMHHLLDALRVKAVVASLDELALRAALAEPELAGRALLLSPNAASRAPEPDPLSWHLGGDYADAVPAYRPLIQRAASRVSSTPGAPGGVRVASLVGEALEDLALAEAVAARIELEGRDADYLFREGRFRSFSWPDDDDARASTLEELAAFAPDLLLVFLGGEDPSRPEQPRLAVIDAIEAQAAGAERRPLYLFGPRAAEDRAVRRLATTNPSFRARAVSFDVARPVELTRASALASRFFDAYPAAIARGFDASPSVYDAVYYLGYALSMAQRRAEVPSAFAVLDGLARAVEPGGVEVPVGPEGIAAALQQIATAAPFELQGTTGPARFTPGQARAGQLELFCWAPGGAEGAAPAASRRRFDPRTLLALDPGLEPACAEELLGAEPAP